MSDSELSFQGYRRADGRVGTRNYLGIFVAGNCAATAARRVADAFNAGRLAAFENVDGVLAFTHELGCGMEKSGEPMDLLRRTICGAARSANLAGALVMALGCERNNIYAMLEQEGLQAGPLLRTVVLQEVGGTAAAIEAGIAAIEEMLPLANASSRETVPASELVVGLLDAAASKPSSSNASGPQSAVGIAADLLVRAGGTVVVSATQANAAALKSRTSTSDVADALQERIVWWQAHTAGRAAAVATGRADLHGHEPLKGVVGYAHPLQEAQHSLILMDSPAYEAIAATGQVASGATLICVVSEDGSTFGAPGAPTVKVATSAEQFEQWQDDLDINGSTETEGAEAVGHRILQTWLKVASGGETRSEALDIGEHEFVPWPVGVLA